MKRLPTLGGGVAAAMLIIGGIAYAIDLDNKIEQALADIRGHGALAAHSDASQRLAEIKVLLIRMDEAIKLNSARLYDLQMRGRTAAERSLLVEPF